MVGNHGGWGHAEEVYRPADRGRASHVGADRSEAEGVIAEGSASQHSVEGRRRWPRLGRCPHRRGVWMPPANGRELAAAAGDRGLRIGHKWSDTGTASKSSGRRTRGEDHRPAAGAAAGGVRQLVAAAVGGAGRRVGHCAGDQPRDGAADAEKNGMTPRKLEYWVIPPRADAKFVAGGGDRKGKRLN